MRCRPRAAACLLALATAPAWLAARPAAAQAPAPIPIEAFFRDPMMTSAALSPSGRHLASIASEGRKQYLVIWNLRTNEKKAVKRFSKDESWRGQTTEQLVYWVDWANDDRVLIALKYRILHVNDLVDLLNQASWWKTLDELNLQLVGDRIFDAERLRSVSPAENAQRLSAPLLIAYGDKDGVVPPRQAERLKRALDGAGKPYEVLVFPDDGHGLFSAENRLQFYRALEAFLARHMQPRPAAQPVQQPAAQPALQPAAQPAPVAAEAPSS